MKWPFLPESLSESDKSSLSSFVSSSCDTRFFISDNINGYSDSASSATVIPSPITDFGGRFVPSNKMADGPRNKKVRTESFYSHTLSGALNPYLELFHGKIKEKITLLSLCGISFLKHDRSQSEHISFKTSSRREKCIIYMDNKTSDISGIYSV